MDHGANWSKWDLHIHSPATRLANGYAENWDGYLSALSKSGLTCIAITNYFCFADNELERVRDYFSATSAEITVFGNIEFRLTQPNKDDEAINAHVLFHEKLATLDINNRLARLQLINTSDANGERPIHCVPNEIREAGLDFGNVTVELRSLQAFLKVNFSPDEYLLAGCPTGYGSFRPARNEGRGAMLAVELDKGCPLMFGDAATRAFYLKVDRYDGAVRKPVFLGSDAHDLETIGTRYSWVKGRASFDGLHHLLCEPESRISLDSENPAEKYPKPYFSKFAMGGSILPAQAIAFAQQELGLNRDLVAIIGGRGSGKSMLMDSLRALFAQAPADLRAHALLRAPESFSATVTKQDEVDTMTFSGNAQGGLQYLHVSQGDIKTVALLPKSLSEAIKALLPLRELNSLVDSEAEFSEIFEEHRGLRTWVNEVDESGQKINTLPFNEGVKKLNEERVKTLTSEKNRSLVERYNLNRKEHADIEVVKQRLALLRGRFERMAEDVKADVTTVNNLLSTLKLSVPMVEFSPQLLAIQDAERQLTSKATALDTAASAILTALRQEGIEQDPKGLLDKVHVYQREIAQAQERIDRYQEKVKRSQEIFEYRKSLVDLRVSDLRAEAEEVGASFARLKAGQEGWTSEQIGLVNRLLSDIAVHGSVYFDIDAFYLGLEEFLNLRRFRAGPNQLRKTKLMAKFHVTSLDTLVRLLSREPIIEEDDGSLITLDTFTKNGDYFASGSNETEFLEYLFKPSFQRRYLSVLATITYKGKPPEQLSVGQRGTFFLCMKLATDPFGSPFVFDQPEDDLDNQFIVEELVPIFREIKQYRQVIIATHNANLVVNADAELIVVAHNDNETLRYEAGSIEETHFRSQICRILEGGAEAFRQRELKYGLSS